MASITKRGDSWYARVRKQGINKAASFQTKTEAKAWATATEAEILAGRRETRTDKTLFDAMERYAAEVSTTKRGEHWERIRLEKFKRLPFAHYKLNDITTPRLAAWRDEQLKTLKASTVNREMNLLSAVFEQCRREWRWIDVNPVRDVRRPQQPKHREKVYSNEEINKIINELGYVDGVHSNAKKNIIARAFLFSIETGMRRQEITGLEWPRVDLSRRVVRLKTTKNGDARAVPLSSKAVEILREAEGQPRPFDVGEDVLSSLFRRACKAAGIDNAHFHDARATAITRLSKKLDVLQLARMIGHRDVKSLMVYYRETAEEIANILG